MIDFHFEDTEVLDIDPEFFGSWLSEVVKLEQKALGNISVIFCSDEYLLNMNKEYLNHDYYTDIITFDYTEDSIVSGDLFISVDRLIDNSNQNNVLFHVEQKRVVVHGVLHLCGYGDKTDEEQLEMTSKEDWALSLIVSRET